MYCPALTTRSSVTMILWLAVPLTGEARLPARLTGSQVPPADPLMDASGVEVTLMESAMSPFREPRTSMLTLVAFSAGAMDSAVRVSPRGTVIEAPV